jgi:hypothetical protein
MYTVDIVGGLLSEDVVVISCWLLVINGLVVVVYMDDFVGELVLAVVMDVFSI